MPLKVNEFVIQAKVIEDDIDQVSTESDPSQSTFAESMKQEIIDECLAKMKELLEKDKMRY